MFIDDTIISNNAPEMPDLMGILENSTHIFIAGGSNAGKSTLILSMVREIIRKRTPEEIGFMILDPTNTQLGGFSNVAHCQGYATGKETAELLKIVVGICQDRHKFFSQPGNKFKSVSDDKPLYVIIDEFAILRQLGKSEDKKEINDNLFYLLSQGRKVHIKLILASQNPSAKTGIPTEQAGNVSTFIGLHCSKIEQVRQIFGDGSRPGGFDLLSLPMDGQREMIIRHNGKYNKFIIPFYTEDELNEIADYGESLPRPVVESSDSFADCNPEMTDFAPIPDFSAPIVPEVPTAPTAPTAPIVPEVVQDVQAVQTAPEVQAQTAPPVPFLPFLFLHVMGLINHILDFLFQSVKAVDSMTNNILGICAKGKFILYFGEIITFIMLYAFIIFFTLLKSAVFLIDAVLELILGSFPRVLFFAVVFVTVYTHMQ